MSSYFLDFYLKDGVLCTRDKDSDLNLEFLRMKASSAHAKRTRPAGRKIMLS